MYASLAGTFVPEAFRVKFRHRLRSIVCLFQVAVDTACLLLSGIPDITSETEVLGLVYGVSLVVFPISLNLGVAAYTIMSDLKYRNQFQAAVVKYTKLTRLEALLYGAMDGSEIEDMLDPDVSGDAHDGATPHWILSHKYFCDFKLMAAGSFGRVFVS